MHDDPPAADLDRACRAASRALRRAAAAPARTSRRAAGRRGGRRHEVDPAAAGRAALERADPERGAAVALLRGALDGHPDAAARGSSRSPPTRTAARAALLPRSASRLPAPAAAALGLGRPAERGERQAVVDDLARVVVDRRDRRAARSPTARSPSRSGRSDAARRAGAARARRRPGTRAPRRRRSAGSPTRRRTRPARAPTTGSGCGRSRRRRRQAPGTPTGCARRSAAPCARGRTPALARSIARASSPSVRLWYASGCL